MSKELLKTICSLKTETLEFTLIDFLTKKGYSTPINKQGQYIIAEGTLPICLIAHLDTVFSTPPEEDNFLYDNEKNILWSPYGSGFDDRAGVTMIIKLILNGYYPSVIFTLGEETGGIGATQLINDFKKCPFLKCNALIELDRMGEKDCVFYNCNNINFKKYIESFGFEEALGTFTDISIIAPVWKIAAVNLSVGYLDEHSFAERLNLYWYYNIFQKIESILKNSSKMKFYKYIPNKQKYNFIGEKNKCFFCEKPLMKHKYKKITESNNIQFNCCDDCYNIYYEYDNPFLF